MKQLGCEIIEAYPLILDSEGEWTVEKNTFRIGLEDILIIDEDTNKILPDYKSEENKIESKIFSTTSNTLVKKLFKRVQKLTKAKSKFYLNILL